MNIVTLHWSISYGWANITKISILQTRQRIFQVKFSFKYIGRAPGQVKISLLLSPGPNVNIQYFNLARRPGYSKSDILTWPAARVNTKRDILTLFALLGDPVRPSRRSGLPRGRPDGVGGALGRLLNRSVPLKLCFV